VVHGSVVRASAVRASAARACVRLRPSLLLACVRWQYPDFFGEEALLEPPVQSYYSVKTVTQCEVFILTILRFNHFLETYPNVRAAVQKYSTSKTMREHTRGVQTAHLENVHAELSKSWHLLRKDHRQDLLKDLQELQSRIGSFGSSAHLAHMQMPPLMRKKSCVASPSSKHPNGKVAPHDVSPRSDPLPDGTPRSEQDE
jgi:CRP-like cAMP-binding protein